MINLGQLALSWKHKKAKGTYYNTSDKVIDRYAGCRCLVSPPGKIHKSEVKVGKSGIVKYTEIARGARNLRCTLCVY